MLYLFMQTWMSVILILITATSMQNVSIPWAHIPVRVRLDTLETDKTAMVRVKETNQYKQT